MRSSSRRAPLLLLAIPQAVQALKVAPGSPCATYCLDSPASNEWNSSASSTHSPDITCRDDSYSSTPTGQKFKKCVSCLQTSSRVYEGESDLHWFTYNLRYAIGTCIFSKPQAALDSDSEPPCNTNVTCAPFKDPLTSDGPSPNLNTTWDYCGNNDGTFMGPNLQPCIGCLRSTKDQTYLANFVTALEAGCKQSPMNVTTLGLSGSIFTSDAVNITDPNADANSQSSNPLSLSAIIGIVVGVVLIFGLAFCLFALYFTRQKASSHLGGAYYYGEGPDSPKTLVDPWGYVITQPRRFPLFHDNNQGPDDTKGDDANGEYYNRIEEATRSGRIQLTHDPRCVNQGPDNAMPAHQAYLPNTVSRKDIKGKATRTPSPPLSVHRHRPSTPDSFIAQAYMAAIEDASRLAKPKPIPTHPPSSPKSGSTITHQSSSSTWTSKIPSFALPKIRIPKAYPPPALALQPATPVGESGERQLRISPPLMHDDPRFRDRPLGAGVVVYDKDRAATPPGSKKYEEYTEVPLPSGKSILFGM